MMKILLFNHPLIGKSLVKLFFFVFIKDIFIHHTFSRDTWPVGPENSAGPRAEKPTKPPYVTAGEIIG